MTDVNKLLTKETAIANKTDPFGKKWGIRADRETALYSIANIDDDGEFRIPRSLPDTMLEGQFTKAVLAEEQINAYLSKAWKKNDEAVAKAEKPLAKKKVEDKTED
jgi:hypothetical protein